MEQPATVLTAGWVVTVSGPVLRGGIVSVVDGRVAWVGARGDPGAPVAPPIDLGPGVLMPGLVNAHCHLELSHLHGCLDASRGFVGWVRELVAKRGGVDPSIVRDRTADAIRALEGTGTVAVGDVSNALAHLDLLAASSLGAVVFYELLAWDPGQADAVIERAAARLSEARRAFPGVDVRLAAHAPYSVSPALFAGLVARGGPAALHLAESPAESRFLDEGDAEWSAFLRDRGLAHVAFAAPRSSPIRYVDSMGVLHPGLVAAHCIQVNAEDVQALARRGVGVAVCPRSNRNLGVGLPPVPELLAAGVLLCLGTDSLASADSLDLMDDVALLHREFPGLDPAAIVRMATAGGAAALGFPDLGTLQPGRRAALAYAEAEAVPADPLEFLVSGEARPRRVAL